MANQEMINYLRQRAQMRGIDPDTLMRVVAGEGGLNDPFRHGEGPAPRGQDPSFGAKENSYGPLQLYISGHPGGGLGDAALAAGIDPRTDWKGGVDFGLNQIANTGWGAWYGAKKANITGMQGITPGGTPLAYNSTTAPPSNIPGLSLMGGYGGVNNPATSLPPLDPNVNVPDPPPISGIRDGSTGTTPTPQPTPVPDTSAPAAPAPTLGAQLKAGDISGALGTIGGSKDVMGAFGGLAKTFDGGAAGTQGQQKPYTPQAPPLDSNSGQIAMAAPQLMAQILARTRKTPGLSLGGMGMMG